MNQYFNIAIDGPAGAGKSTIAKEIARRLNFIYVDTGAMYRAIALYFLQKETKELSLELVAELCQEISITIEYVDGSQMVMLNGENVTGLIRTEAVGNMSSTLSAYPPVREKLLSLQRNLAANANVVMDGRDIGTCVLPDADLKIYLTASTHIRALRRHKELVAKGEMSNLEKIEQDITNRDHRDMTRQTAPLKQAEDAVYLDGSEMTIEEVIQHIITLAKEHGLKVDEWK